jgi:cyclopropane-fatty-acyl-phospholipid synthase
MSTVAEKISGASEEAIQYHYDVGNQFYQQFLDKNMVYSCALWEDGDDLEQAQLRKLDYHLSQSHCQDKERILDIGCGWGALLQRARSNFGVQKAVGLTLSKAQAHYMDKLEPGGLDIRLESWQDHTPEAPYDAIISIGAFEHFAKPEFSDEERMYHYRDFFSYCWRWLKPGARMSLQTISYDNMARKSMSRFIADEIFPESDLPKLGELTEATDGLFSVVQLRNDASHYKETCRQWLSRLRKNREQVIALAGEEKYERYVQYLTLVNMGFHTKNMGLIRVTLARLDRPYRDS